MRIAVPVWENKVSPLLDTAARLLIVEVEGSKEDERFVTELIEQDLPQRCLRIQNMDIHVLICGGISQVFLRMLMAAGMDVIPGVSGDSEDVLTAYLEGVIYNERFLMPGFKRCKMGRKAVLNGVETGCKRRKKRDSN